MVIDLDGNLVWIVNFLTSRYTRNAGTPSLMAISTLFSQWNIAALSAGIATVVCNRMIVAIVIFLAQDSSNHASVWVCRSLGCVKWGPRKKIRESVSPNWLEISVYLFCHSHPYHGTQCIGIVAFLAQLLQ